MREQRARRACTGAVSCLVAASVLLVAAAPLGAVPGGGFKPVAPLPGKLDYDIPLQPWLAEAVAALRLEFVDGVSAEARALEDRALPARGETLRMRAEDVAALAVALREAVLDVGDIDASFGITGVSRLPAVEGAIRDTVLGFMVWYESSDGEGMQVALMLDGLVGRIAAIQPAMEHFAAAVAEQMAGGYQVEPAAHGHHGRHGHASKEEQPPPKADPMDDLLNVLDGLAAEARLAAEPLQGAIDEVRGDATPGSDLRAAWDVASDTTRRFSEACQAVTDAVASFRKARGEVRVLLNAADGVEMSVDELLEGGGDGPGPLHISWEVLDGDISIVQHLKIGVFSSDSGACPDDMKERVSGLLQKIVAADRTLAERAVEYTSARVGSAADQVEAHYRGQFDYDPSASQGDRDDRIAKVDAALRGNLELQSALVGAGAARAALVAGREYEAAGFCSENKAIIQYKYAWIHALNAGASAVRAVLLPEKGD